MEGKEIGLTPGDFLQATLLQFGLLVIAIYQSIQLRAKIQKKLNYGTCLKDCDKLFLSIGSYFEATSP